MPVYESQLILGVPEPISGALKTPSDAKDDHLDG
jgi:hypothetical protein